MHDNNPVEGTVRKFDLQMFSDGEDTTTEVASDSDASSDYSYAQDADGNIHFVDPSEETQSSEQLYTPDELKNTPPDKLDPNRLPPELVPYYKSMQAGYTRASQQTAEQRKQAEMQQAQFQQWQQQMAYQQQMAQQQQLASQPPPDPRVSQKEYYEKLKSIAKSRVQDVFGEEFDVLNEDHQTAYADEIANIKAYVVQSQAQTNELQRVMSTFQQDPEWNNIDAYAYQRINNLPYNVANQVMAGINSKDPRFIYAFLDAVRKDYYAGKNPQTPQVKSAPPHVESGGTGQNSISQPKIDFSKVKNMNTDQQVDFIKSIGLTKF